MAVDSKQKRFSATMLLVPGFTPGVVPTGTIGAALRQAVVWVYSGIAAAAEASAEQACIAFSAGSAAAIAFSAGSAAAIAFSAGPVAAIAFSATTCD